MFRSHELSEKTVKMFDLSEVEYQDRKELLFSYDLDSHEIVCSGHKKQYEKFEQKVVAKLKPFMIGWVGTSVIAPGAYYVNEYKVWGLEEEVNEWRQALIKKLLNELKRYYCLNNNICFIGMIIANVFLIANALQ